MPNNIIGFSPLANAGQGLNFAYQGLLTEPTFRAVLHALETSGKSRTLSVPKVTTVNNKSAKISVGREVLYYDQYEAPSVNNVAYSNAPPQYISPVSTPQKAEDGIILEVTPSVGADMSSIMLRMHPEIIKIDFEQSQQSTYMSPSNSVQVVSPPLPVFTKSSIETEVIVQSGETVAMGGLITTRERKNQQKVPLLGSIPLIGRLFRHDTVEEVKENLLIFVTATILSEIGENLVPMSPQPPAGN
jgi:type II secretory pathway component GspD/PulD (secretin)